MVGRNERGTSDRAGQGGTSGGEGQDRTISRQKGSAMRGRVEQDEHQAGGRLPGMGK